MYQYFYTRSPLMDKKKIKVTLVHENKKVCEKTGRLRVKNDERLMKKSCE